MKCAEKIKKIPLDINSDGTNKRKLKIANTSYVFSSTMREVYLNLIILVECKNVKYKVEVSNLYWLKSGTILRDAELK